MLIQVHFWLRFLLSLQKMLSREKIQKDMAIAVISHKGFYSTWGASLCLK
jgi:hypothetical protein